MESIKLHKFEHTHIAVDAGEDDSLLVSLATNDGELLTRALYKHLDPTMCSFTHRLDGLTPVLDWPADVLKT